jgi:CP family cyanate transporter-like MFS transporter
MAATTASYGVGAALAAVAAVPVATSAGWRWALAYLAVPAAAALAVWALWSRRTGTITRDRERALNTTNPPTASFRPWRHLGVWVLAIFFGLQSALFFATSTWLPSILSDVAGTSAASSGVALSLFQIVGVIGMVSVPILLRWVDSVRLLAVGSMVAWAALFIGILLWPEGWVVWVTLGGLAQGSGVSVALVLVTVRPASHEFVGRVIGHGAGPRIRDGGCVAHRLSSCRGRVGIVDHADVGVRRSRHRHDRSRCGRRIAHPDRQRLVTLTTQDRMSTTF